MQTVECMNSNSTPSITTASHRTACTQHESFLPDAALKISYTRRIGLKETNRENLPLSCFLLDLQIQEDNILNVDNDLYYLRVEVELNLEDKVKEIC